jgi:hypothetical protein
LICSSIQFSYDSVDKAILQAHHTIGKFPVRLSKDSRVRPEARRFNDDVPPRGPILKPSDPGKFPISSSSLDLTIPIADSGAGTYCIHVTNLPSTATAEMLSQKFGYSIPEIVMIAPSSNATSSLECCLKWIKTREEADDFVQNWHRRVIDGREIECVIGEEKLELCRFFRIGMCQHDQHCFWDHVQCKDDRSCPRERHCPYGHARGVKFGSKNDGRSGCRELNYRCVYSLEPNDIYRIKITGLEGPLTSQSLGRTLRHHAVTKYHIEFSQQGTAYVEDIKSYKLARRLLKQWQSTTKGQPSIQYQLELYPIQSLAKTKWNSQSRINQDDEENNFRQRDRTSTRLGNATRFGSNSSISSETTTPKHIDARQESPQFDEPNPNRLTPITTRVTPILRKSTVAYQYDTG